MGRQKTAQLCSKNHRLSFCGVIVPVVLLIAGSMGLGFYLDRNAGLPSVFFRLGRLLSQVNNSIIGLDGLYFSVSIYAQ